MSDIPFGAIVLTDFPFTDLSAAKRRPAARLGRSCVGMDTRVRGYGA